MKDVAQPTSVGEVKQRLVRRLGADWKTGDALPPVRRLAQEFGASLGTTHRAIRDLTADGLLVTRRGSGVQVSRRFTDAQLRALFATSEQERHAATLSQALRGKRLEVLAGNWFDDAFIRHLAQSFRAAVAGAECEVVEGDFHNDGPSIPGPRDADCLVMVNAGGRKPIVVDEGQPLVVIDTNPDVRIAMPGGFDVVSVDQDQGGYLAGLALRDARCESICFLGVCDRADKMLRALDASRLQGFERGYGQKVAAEHILTCDYYGLFPGAAAMAAYTALDPRPRGVFAASDELALGFILGGVSHGLQAGQDYDIVGFDGQERGRRMSGGPLSTIDVPVVQMAQRAAELLASRIADPAQPIRRLFLGCSLFRGNTIAFRTAKDVC